MLLWSDAGQTVFLYVYFILSFTMFRQELIQVEREVIRRDWFPNFLNFLMSFPLRLLVFRHFVAQQDGMLLRHKPL